MANDDSRLQGIIITAKEITYFPWLMEKEFASYVKSGKYEKSDIVDSEWRDKPVDFEAISAVGRKMYSDYKSRIDSEAGIIPESRI